MDKKCVCGRELEPGESLCYVCETLSLLSAEDCEKYLEVKRKCEAVKLRPQLKADYFDAETQLFIVTISAKDNHIIPWYHIIPIDTTILADDGCEWNCYLVKATYVNNLHIPGVYTCKYRKI